MSSGSTFPSPRTVLETVIAPVFARFPALPLPRGAGKSSGHLFVTVANHLLAQTGWAAQRLRPFAGRQAQVVIGAQGSGSAAALRFPFAIGNDGLLVTSLPGIPADVTLSLPMDALGALPGSGLEAVLGRVKVSGAADLAETLGFVFRHLRWDGEADLARLLGDIPARRLSLWATMAWRWQQDAGRRLLANGAEYLVEERGMVPSRQAVQEFGSAVDRLRDDLARLEKRLQRLGEQSRHSA